MGPPTQTTDPIDAATEKVSEFNQKTAEKRR
jgi:hypothetical protein